ncbi:MAG: extensin family protein [Cypionkella sp.]
MVRGAAWLMGAALIAVPFMGFAQEPTLRPVPRPAGIAQAAALAAAAPAQDAAPVQDAVQDAAAKSAQALRPKPRPNLAPTPATAPRVARSPLPKSRPATLAALQAPSASPEPSAPPKPGTPKPVTPKPGTPAQNQPRKGSVCGDRAIRGEVIGSITSKTQGCGVADAVRVTELSGVRLSQAITVECGTAVALKDWIDRAMRPAFGRREVVQLRIAAHYACRGRNNKRGARISEHGKGKAIDVSGFIFSDGTEWSILRDYNKQIRTAHKGACGIFGTTLGPGSDGFHEDHLHFDTASYRSGPYCR